MATHRHTNESQRIRELEARVAELTHEVEALRAERRASTRRGRRAGDPTPPGPPLRRRIWMARGILLLMTFSLACAAYTVARFELWDFNWDQNLGQQLAGVSVDYPLLALVALSLLAFLTYLSRRMVLFMVLALVCSYVTYWVYLAEASRFFPVPSGTYFWLSLLYLLACYSGTSWLCIYESLRTGRRRRRVAVLALANSLAFYGLLWIGLQTHAPEATWYICAGLGVLAVFFALLAESIGSHRNYMFQLFTATAILLFNAALHSVLSDEGLLIALAVECLLLAAMYHATGIVVLKVLNLVALVVTVVLALQSTKLGAPVAVGGVTLRQSWLYGLITSAFLLCATFYYERHIRSLQPQDRRLSGHWFLADTFWDVPSSTAGLLHAAGAALIIMVLTIADFGERPSLPYMLAAESIAFALLGFVMRTPQLEVSAVMMIVATHVSYYFFLAIGKEEFSDQAHFSVFTLLVVGYTFFGAYRWDRYLRGLQEGHPWEHYFGAAVPYLVATAMLLTLMERQLAAWYVPLAFGCMGLALVIVGVALADAAIKTSGVAAVLAGAALYLARLPGEMALSADPVSWVVLSGLLLLLFLVERTVYLSRHEERDRAQVERLARTVLALALAVAGFMGLHTVAAMDVLPLYWVGLACICTLLGALFRENRYRWAALLVLAGALAWTFGYDRLPIGAPESKRLIAGAGATLLLLVGSWGLAVRRQSQHGKLPSMPATGSSPDG